MKRPTRSTWTAPTAPTRWRQPPQKTPGVKNATVNFMTLKMNVEFEDGQDHKAVMQQVYANCKKGGGRLRDLRHLTRQNPTGQRRPERFSFRFFHPAEWWKAV